MRKTEYVWKGVLLLGVVLSAVAIVANCFLEKGLNGLGFWLGFLAVVVTYVLFLIDLLFEFVEFPWGKRWGMVERSIKKPLLWRLIVKGSFVLTAIYACINTVFSFNILGRGETAGPYYLYSIYPLFYIDQSQSYSIAGLLKGYCIELLIPVLLFCLVVVLSIRGQRSVNQGRSFDC